MRMPVFLPQVTLLLPKRCALQPNGAVFSNVFDPSSAHESSFEELVPVHVSHVPSVTCLTFFAPHFPRFSRQANSTHLTLPLTWQILMAIDDSESMADCGAGALALAAMTTVASGLTQLEAGQLAVARYVKF